VNYRSQVEKGKRILHVEKSKFYGGLHEAALRLDELESAISAFENSKIQKNDEQQRKSERQSPSRILLDINPYVMSSRGPLASKLLSLGLSPYLDFRPIDNHGLILDGVARIIPKSKEKVMLDSSLSLIEKRQIMRLLTTIADETFETFVDITSKHGIEMDSLVIDLLIYGVCGLNCPRNEIAKIPKSQIIQSVRSHLQSLQYLPDSSGLLYPHGGTNSIIQALCRMAAVKGVTHLLGQSELAIQDHKVTGTYEDRTWEVAAPIHSVTIQTSRFTRGIMLLTETEGLFGDNGCNYWIIPPSTCKYPINILQVDHATGCTPPDTLLLYIWSQDCTMEELQSAISKFVDLPNKPSGLSSTASMAIFYYNDSTMNEL
jgi:RAB protein geranylgeranyltransferase component A